MGPPQNVLDIIPYPLTIFLLSAGGGCGDLAILIIGYYPKEFIDKSLGPFNLFVVTPPFFA